MVAARSQIGRKSDGSYHELVGVGHMFITVATPRLGVQGSEFNADKLNLDKAVAVGSQVTLISWPILNILLAYWHDRCKR